MLCYIHKITGKTNRLSLIGLLRRNVKQLNKLKSSQKPSRIRANNNRKQVQPPKQATVETTSTIAAAGDSPDALEFAASLGLMSRHQPQHHAEVPARPKSKHQQQEELEFLCRFCGKGYRWKSTMRRHENFECGDKPPSFQCPQCPYKARQRGNLTVHLKRHHQKG
ncbi:hypothetical protein TSAR_011808 [Trichomalopsis sarcophagae]|uniref:C2H2-type domain-containing protein n=1 Tax=Trichomalopsis sarcophagae TaxID=543379 RepID=A0A232F601_9HYME|nr:hypothetical protein TSAR_011808 [Trichomalopsis sarcophagae]